MYDTPEMRRKEVENKKLVDLVTILSNKIFQDIKETKTEMKMRYEDNAVKLKKLEINGVANVLVKDDDEIFGRTLENKISDQYIEAKSTSETIEDFFDYQEKAVENLSSLDNVVSSQANYQSTWPPKFEQQKDEFEINSDKSISHLHKKMNII